MLQRQEVGRFDLGKVRTSRGAEAALRSAPLGQGLGRLMIEHAKGAEVTTDAQGNPQSVSSEFVVGGQTIYAITESDRSRTVFLTEQELLEGEQVA